MDVFIKTLSFTNNTKVTDVSTPCFKILTWLTLETHNKLTYTDVEVLIKSATYIDECFARFGKELENDLIENNPYHEFFLTKYLRDVQNPNCMTYACLKILKSTDGIMHMMDVQKMLESIDSPLDLQALLVDVVIPGSSHVASVQTNHDKMELLVEQLFQLPSEQIVIAIDRALNRIHFGVLGHIFLEAQHSSYFTRCNIIEEHICEKLIASDVSAEFMESMFITAAKSDVGMQFYLKCLENRRFSDALGIFFESYLSNVQYANINENHLNDPRYKKYEMHDIFFLIYGALKSDSPCQTELHLRLTNTHVTRQFVHIINKISFAYD